MNRKTACALTLLALVLALLWLPCTAYAWNNVPQSNWPSPWVPHWRPIWTFQYLGDKHWFISPGKHFYSLSIAWLAVQLLPVVLLFAGLMTRVVRIERRRRAAAA